MTGIIIAVVLLLSIMNVSYALTPDEIIKMKEAGISDEVILKMIEKESAESSNEKQSNESTAVDKARQLEEQVNLLYEEIGLVLSDSSPNVVRTIPGSTLSRHKSRKPLDCLAFYNKNTGKQEIYDVHNDATYRDILKKYMLNGKPPLKISQGMKTTKERRGGSRTTGNIIELGINPDKFVASPTYSSSSYSSPSPQTEQDVTILVICDLAYGKGIYNLKCKINNQEVHAIFVKETEQEQRDKREWIWYHQRHYEVKEKLVPGEYQLVIEGESGPGRGFNDRFKRTTTINVVKGNYHYQWKEVFHKEPGTY